MALQTLRIFVSSPGDVSEERVLARRVIERLAGEFADRVVLEAIFWEHEPLLATATFQAQIVRPSETDIVACILWSRLGTRLPSAFTRPDGTRYASGTEYEFEDAVEAKKVRGAPDLLVYRKIAEPLVSLGDRTALLQRLSQREALEAFCQKWFHDATEGTLIAAFHAFLSSAEFEERLEEHLRKLVLLRIPPESGEPLPVKPTWKQGSPFRGLEVFEFEHAPIFFGRTKAIGDVLNALRKNAGAGRAFVLVLGASGSGKSSLVRAGVLPLLTQPGVIEGVGLWRRSVLRPSDSPDDLFLGLAKALLQPQALPELKSDGTSEEELAGLLRENPKAASILMKGGLSQAAAQLALRDKLDCQPDARLVLAVDQLEEIFTLEKVGTPERAAFVDALSALARSQRVCVIGTLRSDFYPRCAELPELLALKEGSGQYDLMLPTPTEIGQTIRQPALAAGLRFEEDPETKARLDDVLRDAAAGHPESLPLLEFALEELYKQRTPRGALTHAAYKQLGGVEGALAQRAEQVFSGLAPEVQGAFGRVFRALVNVGETEAVARRQAALGSAAATPEARAFLEAFVKARLFTAGAAADGMAVVHVAHEALLRNWPRVVKWLEQDRELLRMRGRVAQACSRWEQEKRSVDLLLPEGKPLDEATQLLRALGPELSAEQSAFIRASAARAKLKVRLKRLAVAALIVLAIAAGTSAVLAERSREEANRQKQVAQEQRNLAERSAGIANEQRQLALKTIHDLIFDVQDKLHKPGLLGVQKSILDLAKMRLKEIQQSAAASVSAAGDAPGADRYTAGADMRLGDVFLVLGQTAEASAAYQRSHALFFRLAAASPDDARAQSDLQVSFGKLGDASLALGNAAAARDRYEDGLKIAQTLAAHDPKDSKAQRDLAFSHQRIGDVLLQLQDVEASREHYETSLKIAQAISAADPSKVSARRDLSVAYDKLGDVRYQVGNSAAAKEAYSSSQKIAQELAAADPANAQYQRDLLLSYQNLGDVALQSRASSEAGAQYVAALKIAESLAAADSENFEHQRDLGIACDKVGDMKFKEGDLAGAREQYTRAQTIFLAMSAADPANAQFQRDVGVSYDNLADVSLRLGELAAARDSFEKSLKLRAAFAAANPGDGRAQSDLSVSYQSLGDLCMRLDDVPTAKENYAKSLACCRAVVDRDATNAVARRDLGMAYDRMGDVSVKLLDFVAAREDYTTGITIKEALAAADPANADVRRDLIVGYNDLGNLELKAGNFAAEKAICMKALAIAREYAAVASATPEARRDLEVCLGKVADAEQLLNDLTTARDHYAEGLKIAQALADAAPADAIAQHDLAFQLDRFGDICARLNDARAARASYNQCITEREALVAADPGNLQYKRELLLDYNALAGLCLREKDTAAVKTNRAGCVKMLQALSDAEPANPASRRQLAVELNQLGDVTLQLLDARAANDLYADSLTLCENLLAGNPTGGLEQTDVAFCNFEIGRAAEVLLQPAEALKSYDRAIAILQPLNDEGKLKEQPGYVRLIDILKQRAAACTSAATSQPATRPE